MDSKLLEVKTYFEKKIQTICCFYLSSILKPNNRNLLFIENSYIVHYLARNLC